MPERWNCTLTMKTDRRPGVLEKLAYVFAARGINLDEVHTSAPGGIPLITLRFGASSKVKEYLARRIGQLQEVCGVDIQPD